MVGRMSEHLKYGADLDLDARLFPNLPRHGNPRILAGIEKPTGQRPQAAARFHDPPYQQQLAIAKDGSPDAHLRVAVS